MQKLMCLISFLLPAFLSASLCVGVIGDSISLPWPVDNEHAWHSILADKFDWKIVNYSVGGSTTDTLSERMTKLINEEDPSIIIIALGINDSALGKSMQEVYRNMYQAINYALKRDIYVLIGTVDIQIMGWHGKEYSRNFIDIYKMLANHFKHGVEFFPFMTTELMNNPIYFGSPDHFHPNELGHFVIANEVMKLDKVWKR